MFNRLRKPSDQRHASHDRLAAAVRSCCQALEQRTLLSTFTVNGTGAADHWTIQADAGAVLVNGVLTSDGNITAVQINGQAGDDTVILMHATIPVTFSGGQGNDTFEVGGSQLTDGIHANITFHGDGDTDFANCRDESLDSGSTYTLANNTVSWSTGSLFNDSTVEHIALNTGSGDNTVNVQTITALADIRIQGNSGADAVNIAGITSGVTVLGGDGDDTVTIGSHGTGNNHPFSTILPAIVSVIGGDGDDTLVADDFAATVGNYSIDSFGLKNTSQGSSIQHDSTLEHVDFYARNNGGAATTITSPSNGQNYRLFGGAGFDSLTLDDRPMATQPQSLELYPDHIVRNFTSGQSNTPYQIDYAGYDALTIFTANITHTINVFGSSPEIDAGQQTTILTGTGSDVATFYPHDAEGNLTFNTPVGFSGGAGSDTCVIDDLGSTSGITYTINNMFGASTADIFGLGTSGVGAANDVERILILAGDGDDNFNVDSFKSGSALLIYGQGGANTVNMAQPTRNLATSITSMSQFFFDGGPSGNSQFNIFNDNSTDAFSYATTNALVQVSNQSYFAIFNYTNCGYIFEGAGSSSDTFNVLSTNANSNTDLFGNGGDDFYDIGDAGFTQGIEGTVTCRSESGLDTVIVDDDADTVGRIVHISPRFVGNSIGDTIFGGPDGVVDFNGIKGSVQIRLGSGGDTIYAAPGTTSPVSIQANNPNVLPGDALTVATGVVSNPVYHNLNGGSGNFTYTGSLGFDFSGIEQLMVASGRPTVLSVDFTTTDSGPALLVQFSRDVSRSLYANFATLVDQNDPFHFIDGDSLSYDTDTNTATFGFSNLADGNYSASLSYNKISDLYGNTMAADVSYSFAYITGTSDDDQFRIARDPNTLEYDIYVNDDDSPALIAAPFTDNIVLEGGDGDDSLTVEGTQDADVVSFDASAVTLNGQTIHHANFEHLIYVGEGDYDQFAINSGTVTITGDEKFEKLCVNNDAACFLSNAANGLVVARSLNVAPTATLDLNDNDFLLDSLAGLALGRRGRSAPAASSLPDIQALINSARDGGAWDGFGLTSSAARSALNQNTTLGAMGVADYRSIYGPDATFDGQSLNDDAVLIKYTYYGDANFNGQVDGGDYARIDFTFGQEHDSGDIGGWINGDFNGDGKVNGSDYGLMDFAFSSQDGGIRSSASATANPPSRSLT